MFKWLTKLFKKKEKPAPKVETFGQPVVGVLKLTPDQIRTIADRAVKDVAAKKIVTNMIEENRRQRPRPPSPPPIPARKVEVQPAVQTRRYDNDDQNLLMTAVLVSQVSSSSSSSYSSNDGGSYDSGSCSSDSGGGGGCD